MLKVAQMVILFMSTLYLSLIVVLFFVKKRISNDDTEIYKKMLITNLNAIIIEFILYMTGNTSLVKEGLGLSIFLILSKLFVGVIVGWFILIAKYTLLICDKARSNKLSTQNKKKLNRIINIAYIIVLIIILLLPVEFILLDNGATGYTQGPATMFAAALIISLCVFMLIELIRARKKLNRKEFTPIIILLILMMISTSVQSANPQILLFNPVMALVMVIMYFTIENPDVKMIEQLDMAKTQAEKANKAKTDFLSNMSHEIRTPLNAIVGFSECLVEREDLNDETKEFAKDIVDASNNLLEIVNGILDISKIEANKMEIICKEYNPREVFNSLCKLVIPRIGEKPIQFKYTYSEDLPGVLKGDVAKLKQIILNLLTNAAKYTDEGEINFNVNCINRMDTNTSLLYISVKDTGRGIKKENIDKLFNKFERIDEDRNTTIEGTGLGLAITKSLVEMMGGRVNVFSKFGEGSTFRIYLEQEIVSMEIPEDKTEEIEIDYKAFENKKILIVDDSKINLKVAEQILKPYNFDIVSVESGMEALEIAQSKTFDLILMDIMMPKMNGIEALNKLKEIPGFNVPVVALTADAIEGTDEKYKNAGFDDYLSKPIDRYLLNKVLKKFLK